MSWQIRLQSAAIAYELKDTKFLLFITVFDSMDRKLALLVFIGIGLRLSTSANTRIVSSDLDAIIHNFAQNQKVADVIVIYQRHVKSTIPIGWPFTNHVHFLIKNFTVAGLRTSMQRFGDAFLLENADNQSLLNLSVAVNLKANFEFETTVAGFKWPSNSYTGHANNVLINLLVRCSKIRNALQVEAKQQKIPTLNIVPKAGLINMLPRWQVQAMLRTFDQEILQLFEPRLGDFYRREVAKREELKSIICA